MGGIGLCCPWPCVTSPPIVLEAEVDGQSKAPDHRDISMFSRIEQQYRGSIAVVIGAGGIGGEITRLLLTTCSRVVVADHSEGALVALAKECGPAKLLTRTLDVRDSKGVED